MSSISKPMNYIYNKKLNMLRIRTSLPKPTVIPTQMCVCVAFYLDHMYVVMKSAHRLLHVSNHGMNFKLGKFFMLHLWRSQNQAHTHNTISIVTNDYNTKGTKQKETY